MNYDDVAKSVACVPRLRLAPKAHSNDWRDARDLAIAYGLTPDPWQDLVLQDTLAETAIGTWASPRVGISVPRQNGKNGYVEARELAGLLLYGERILHTAHEVKTAMMAFRRLRTYFEQHEDLKRLVTKISNTNGQEGIWLSNGASIQFVARSKSSGRGFSVDLLVLDEAQELADETFAAILPTISASPNPQVILLGTPPGPTTNGEVFARFREGGVEGTDKRLCWLEWSADEDDDFSDPDVWRAANPALGIRLEEETVADEYAAMDLDVFCRERLGMWKGTTSFAVIGEDTWSALASETDPKGRVSFAIDVAPDRSKASISVAGYLPDGERASVQTIENRKGTGWVAPRLAELQARWPNVGVVLDSAGPAAALLPELRKHKVKRVYTLSTREVVQSCGAFYDAAMNATLAHTDQPLLNEALASAKKRLLGDAWAWHRTNSTTDLTPLVSATFALFGLTRKPARTKGSSKVVVL